MTDYWVRALRDARAPQIEDTMPTGLDGAGDAESSDGVSALIQNTKPDRIAEAGRRYEEIANMCERSVELLHKQAGAIAETLGGQTLEQVFKTIDELQKDLARIVFAARSVSRPLIWYGEDVLPWFRDNVPRTGDKGWLSDIDDAVGDDVFQTDTNAHALARHHLRQLNRFMGEAYNAMGDYVEQRSTAPQVGMNGEYGQFGPQPGLGSNGNPYLGSPYGSPDLGGTPGLGGPDVPGLDDPSLQDPSLRDPSLQDPSQQDPSLKDPSLQDPSLKDPSLQDAAQNPDLRTPDLKTPEIKSPELPQTPSPTDLSAVPQTSPQNLGNIPATGPGAPSGSAPATQLGSATATPPAGGRPGAGGMPMGMIPPMMGGAGQGGQGRDRERATFPLVEDEAFETDDMGGPSVVA
ncbi:hypothetical protein E1295_47855 [Nonomuraea mesophila]|uniref:WXG100 family type VII secretion target n=1 Tax=Nonomuraea mesophila TaxID=2530382 RepID=A0A4R5E1D9_9ACTN|nr:hypothetical protein [Nonomuraea mesophila]TDE19131.1 hypothetical protein E1295_47855 [Nonomuraea mesophila]